MTKRTVSGATGTPRGVFNYPSWNAIRINRSDPSPLYEQVFAQIRAAALEGRLRRGARLPPSRRLAEELDVSRATIVLAYDKLASEGYIRRRTGSGAYLEAVLPEDHRPKRQSAPEAASPAPRGPSRRGGRLLDRDLPPERRDRMTFSPGIPALAEFPYDVFAQIAHRRWRDHATSHTGFDYAHGAPELRSQIAGYLAEARGLVCRPEQVIIVGSTIQAASLVAYALLDGGDRVLTEDPCHLLQSAAFEGWGLAVTALALDENGFDIAAADKRALDARLAVVTPVGQFPFGCTMSAPRRRALTDWARAGGAWVLEDDFNSEIRWAGEGTPPLAAADPARVLYTSSLNRVLAPGLRLAYLVAPPDLVDALAAAQRTFSLYAPLPDQALVADFMAQGRLASHLRRMRGVYRERAAALCDALRSLVGDLFVVDDVEAGLHMTIRARAAIDDAAISKTLLANGFDCPALSRYYRGPQRRSGFVLGFGAARPDHIRNAAQSFAAIVRTALPG